MVAVLLAPRPPRRSEGRLQPRAGATVVIVWRNAKAQDEGAALIRAGVNKSDPSRRSPFICVYRGARHEGRHDDRANLQP